MTKILIVGSDSSVKGGITTVIDSFLNYKWSKGIKVELLPTYIEGSLLKRIIFFVKSIIKYLYKLLKDDFDIAHIHMSYKGSFFRKYLVVRLGKVFKKKIIIHLHGSEFEVFYNKSNRIVKKMIKSLLENVDCVLVLGESWGKLINSIASKSNVIILNNSVKIPNFTAEWNENKINILFLGVLIKRKGIYELIEAIRYLDKDGIIEAKKINFIIGGAGSEENNINSLINKYDLNHCIDMVGWVNAEDKVKLLRESQIFILPSYNEGLPMAILEAMSYGIPTISTDVGSISEVVNKVTGELILPKDINEIKNSIIKIINSREEWEKKSESAKKLIVNKFNIEEYFRKIENLYLGIHGENIWE